MKRSFSLFLHTSLLLLICLLGALHSYSQETRGAFRGRITDSLNHPLEGATVRVIHVPTGTPYTTTTSKDGRYNLPGLLAGGPYQLTVTSMGFAEQEQSNLQVGLGEAQVVNFTLKPGSQQLEAVTVKASAGPRKPANQTGAGVNISREQISNMPTISRSITDVTKLVPQGSKDNSFAGTNFRYNNVTIDGAINNDAIGFSPSLGGIVGTSNMPGSSTRSNPISMDAIQDMQVYLAPYDVTLGNFTGGSVNAVTRSGTNKVEGSVYTFGRNATITGKENAGDGSKLPSAFHDNQTGFRVGFPIIKGKLFFFTNEEIARRTDPIMQGANSPDMKGVLSLDDAMRIHDTMVNRYGFDPGAYGQFNAYANSNKYFNRIDWNIDGKTHLAIRNNTITSEAINLERDPQDFRFGSIAYKQTNNQSSTVAELTTRFNNRVYNSLIAGFTTIHDYRTPSSDAAFPQVQIVGRTPGTTIFLGTDREASIFNMKQRTFEFTDNVSVNLGKHHLTFGTHNELYKINYGFVNSWNGRVDYASIDSFFNNSPSRVRGNFNYENNDRDYILAHPSAVFNVNFFSVYAQDEIQVNDRFRITPGIRFDYADVPNKQTLSDKTRSAITDPNYGNSYTYTPLRDITNNYLGRVQVSPRLGFNYDVLGDKSLVVRGGTGLFTGRIPFAWIGYAFYNTGDSYGSYDQKTDGGFQFLHGTDPLKHAPGEGIAGFARDNGAAVDKRGAGQTQVDVIDNHFVMPQVWRSSVAVDYTDQHGFKYTLEGMYTQVIKDVMFQQVNLSDISVGAFPYYYDTAASLRRQPIFGGGNADPQFANAYEMSNTAQGRRLQLTAQVSKNFNNGLRAMVAYTYGVAKDIANGIRNSMESNWQLNQALNPNNPGLAYSNFDIRHRIIGNVTYRLPWHNNNWVSTFALFGSMQSGAPITYGFINYTVQKTPQQVSLAYIPNRGEAINFFRNPDGAITTSAEEQAKAFNAFIDGDAYLRTRRGRFTERNGARTPWNNDLDFHFSQEFGIVTHKDEKPNHVITFTWDILNVTNLINKNWGWVYFSPNTYNSTASVGLVPFLTGSNSSQGYPLYSFQDPGKPYSVDYAASRWQMQFGIRYSF
ncbi:TonB-dependent receptor [Niastella yeongjuensis]|uniref:TonB-dependent receptor n=1 Tax=Niastella yeongjuensis TaxID=354355 RepID=A0A1V9EVU9_9BACT|nr:carboxypeptidase regulatory-like domain-containing protein [Niastella yeongjuensis]OQP50288.1 TonB-dependent receptor [Niastella yeongjuensis]SEN41028.1 Carboxypeptidase regulatory-like domain-containing protein [Niastella yeongjuensis]